jgi:hypothetical protein
VSSVFKEYRKDGWPFCPRCEEDELYSHLMLGWSNPDSTPTVQQCIESGMTCYQCSWTLPKANARIFPNCFRCDQTFDLEAGEPQYIYCPPCRVVIRTEAEKERVRGEVERMEWPEVLGV